MKGYGSIESIVNDVAKIVLDSGEEIYRNVSLIHPDILVSVGRVVQINGYRLTIDLEEGEKRVEEIKDLQNSIFSRGRTND